MKGELLDAENLKSIGGALLSVLGTLGLLVGTLLSRLVKDEFFLKRLLMRFLFKGKIDYNLIDHPFFADCKEFNDFGQYKIYYKDDEHRNKVFVVYMRIVYKICGDIFEDFCARDLDKTYKGVDTFEVAIKRVFDRVFGEFSKEVANSIEFPYAIQVRMQYHAQESHKNNMKAFDRVLKTNIFSLHDRNPNKRKMYQILDSLAQSIDNYSTTTETYFKYLNGQMKEVKLK